MNRAHRVEEPGHSPTPSHDTLLACPSLTLSLHICMTKNLHSWSQGCPPDLTSVPVSIYSCSELGLGVERWSSQHVPRIIWCVLHVRWGACGPSQGSLHPLCTRSGPLSHGSPQHLSETLVPGWLLPQVCPWKALAIGSLLGVYVTGWVARRACTKGSVTLQGDLTTSCTQCANSRGESTLGTGAGNSASTLHMYFLMVIPLFTLKRKGLK